MSEPAGHRRLTPAQILLIVVVSALVLLFVVLLVGRLSGGGGERAAEATTPPPATTQTPDESGPTSETSAAGPEEAEETPTSAHPEYFASPSGNIVCALTVDSTDCVISSFDYAAEDAASCDDDAAGGHLRVEPAGASMPCEPLVVAGGVPTLDYGETTSAHGYTCESAESGVTCRHDESGYGFTVARRAYDLF